MRHELLLVRAKLRRQSPANRPGQGDELLATCRDPDPDDAGPRVARERTYSLETDGERLEPSGDLAEEPLELRVAVRLDLAQEPKRQVLRSPAGAARSDLDGDELPHAASENSGPLPSRPGAAGRPAPASASVQTCAREIAAPSA